MKFCFSLNCFNNMSSSNKLSIYFFFEVDNLKEKNDKKLEDNFRNFRKQEKIGNV